MTVCLSIAEAAHALRSGAVIAYPTEAVWGLGCDPADRGAVLRLLAIKRRAVEKGLILVGGALAQLDAHIDWAALPAARRDAVLATWPGPHTWTLPTTAHAPRWITGAHATLAVRVSAHPTVVALCAAFGGALVSTSANRAGAPPPRAFADFDPDVLAAIDGYVAGDTGGLERPTPIRDARTGEALRD